MTKYRNEAAFSNAFCKALRDKGWFIQRIESGMTGKGIPDIYAISPTNKAVWFELKREHTVVGRKACVEIHWRQGQQAWLYDTHKREQAVYTIAAFDDCILQIPHNNVYSQNMVSIELSGVRCYKNLQELVK